MIESPYRKIYRVISRIPPGRVATYGQIARLAGLPGHARMVGYALHASPPDLNLPWHRVINAKGEISRLPDPDASRHQKEFLESEGIHFNARGRIPLNEFQWQPPH